MFQGSSSMSNVPAIPGSNDPTALANASPTAALAALQQENFGDDLFKQAGGSEGLIGFLPRLQLFTANSNEVKRGNINLAHYATIAGKEKTLTDLGKNVLLVPIAWRPKALNTKADPVTAFHNPLSKEFKEFKAKADADANSGYMYGPEFLVYIPDKEIGFATFFMGSKSARNESAKLRALLPVGGNPLRPAMCTAQFIETKEYSWHAPQVMPSSQQVTLPDMDKINEIALVFLKPKDSEIEEKADATAVNADR
jgi:hypothetical protein